MHASVAQMEALRITHLSKSASFIDELQLPNKRIKSVDLRVYINNTMGLCTFKPYSQLSKLLAKENNLCLTIWYLGVVHSAQIMTFQILA